MQLEECLRRHWDSLFNGMNIPSIHKATSLTCGADRFGVRSEELFQRLWIPARDLTNSIGNLAVFLTIPEVLPKMGQMIECVGIDSLLHCIRPLLVCDWHIADRPPDSFTKGFDNLPHC